MTLDDLLLLLKHYMRWVVAIPLVCMIALGGGMAIANSTQKVSFSAMSSLAVSDTTGSLSPNDLTLLLYSVARNTATEANSEDVEVKIEPESATQSVVFKAFGGSGEEAIEAANAVADQTAERVRETLNLQADTIKSEAGKVISEGSFFGQDATCAKVGALESCVLTVSMATGAATEAGTVKILKFAAFGLIAGLFITVLVLILLDAAKSPIKSRNDVARLTDLPIVNGRGGENGARLACATVLTVSEKRPIEICLIEDQAFESDFRELFEKVLYEETDCARSVLTSAPPFSESSSGFFAARQSDVVLVCVKCWCSTASSLLFTLDELKLAEAKTVGVVLV